MAYEEVETPQPGPWAADLAEYFQDEEALAAADRYMREKQQPRMTELEQGHKQWNDLLESVRQDPRGEMKSMMDELFGADVADRFDTLFEDAAPAEAAKAVEQVAEAAGAQLSQEQQDLLDWAKAKRQAEADEATRASQQSEYDQAKAGMREAHPDLSDEDMELIDPFIGAAGGDTERAYSIWQSYQSKFRERHGVAAPEPAPTPEAPAVLGDQAATAATPPVDKKYTKWGDIDAAFDDWQNEQRAGDPPPVL